MSPGDDGPLTDAGPAQRQAASVAAQAGPQFVGSLGRPDEYRLIGEGRRGGEGITWRAHYQGNLPRAVEFAIKQLVAPPGRSPEDWPDPAQLDRWNQQIKLLHLVRHDHLVTYKEFFDGWPPHPGGSCSEAPPASLRTWYLAMEWVDGPSLQEAVREGRVGLTERIGYIVELADAVEQLHSGAQTQGMVLLHRDIKPGNVIINPDRGAVLVDFGLLRVEEPTLTAVPAWTGPYLAPEVHADKTRTSRASDLWALAGTAFFAITGEHPSPFDAELMRRQLATTLEGQVDQPALVIDAVMAVLANPPDQRPVSPRAWSASLAAAVPQSMESITSDTGILAESAHCPRCGASLQPDSDYCAECGIALPTDNRVRRARPAKGRRRRSTVAVMVLVGTLVAIAAGALVLHRASNGSSPAHAASAPTSNAPVTRAATTTSASGTAAAPPDTARFLSSAQLLGANLTEKDIRNNITWDRTQTPTTGGTGELSDPTDFTSCSGYFGTPIAKSGGNASFYWRVGGGLSGTEVGSEVTQMGTANAKQLLVDVGTSATLCHTSPVHVQGFGDDNRALSYAVRGNSREYHIFVRVKDVILQVVLITEQGDIESIAQHLTQVCLDRLQPLMRT